MRKVKGDPGLAALVGWEEEDGIKYPVVAADQVGNQFSFLCPWCGARHYHGIQEGHREAHCSDVSLAPKHGYILRRKR